MNVDQFVAGTPEKLELLDGRIPGDEELLGVLLYSVGLRRAIQIVGRERWRIALDEIGRSQ